MNRLNHCVLGVLLALPAPAASLLHTDKTEKIEFAAGGTIRIEGSHGDLNVEGWDRPEVEITLLKAAQHHDVSTFTIDRKSSTELTITTKFPKRSLRRLNRGKSGLLLEYQIRVPRDSHLIVRHDEGEVILTNLTGDVEARNGTGDIAVMVPADASYTIDAKTRFGGVDSDFGGPSKKRKLVAHELAFAQPAAKHHLNLHVGVGGINIEEMSAPAAYPPAK
jgi:hypothetical protein